MTEKILKFSFIIFCALISFVLFGCKRDGIQFYRESAINSVFSGIQNEENKDKVSKSSGLVIYKDGSTHNNDKIKTEDKKFGPKDLDFDLPIKF